MTQSPPSTSEALSRAVAHHQAGQLPQAEQIYRQVLQADPRNADAWHLLGVIAAQVNNHQAAIDHIRRAIELNPNSTAFHANLGAAYQKVKQFDNAVSCYRRALELNPNNAEAHNNLGVALLGRSDPATAEACFRRAVKHNPNYAEAHSNLGNSLQALGKPAEALAAHQRATVLKPGYAEAHHGMGAALAELDRTEEAISAYRRSLQHKENSPETYNNLGVALKNGGWPEGAAAAYRRALELKPDYAEAHTNLGNVLREQGQLDEAAACHRRALQVKPDCAEFLNNLGAALQEQNKLEEALDCFRRAAELKPDFAEAYDRLAKALKDRGQFDEAIACQRRVVEIKPGDANAYNNLGIALKDAAQLSAAIAYYRRAIELDPNMAEAHNNLGSALKDLGKLDEALPCYRRALELRPDFADVHSNWLFTLHYRPGITLAELADAHAEFERRHAAPLRANWPMHRPRGKAAARLRLGFVSPDFCTHPVGIFSIRAVENLDPAEVEIVCYNDRGISDPLTERFQAAASVWRETLGWSHERLAACIRDDEIDILFDLAGHTARNRLLAFARKPAPIQISWIGNEGTTGLSAIDFVLADRYMAPQAAEAHYREKVLRMPDSYVCYDPPQDAPPVSELPALRVGHVTFGSCNNLAKINAQVVVAWSEILRRVPGSRLLLKYRGLEDDQMRAHYLGLFTAQGIAPERLEIEGWTPLTELLAAHDRIDVALDPFPFAGGVTTCNSIWMGVPVVTWPGETFASRHSLSYLSVAGLTESIAAGRDEYIEIASRLAGDLTRLAKIRSGLREQVASSPLCDGKRFAEQLMALLRGIYTSHV
jgi:protein O-GlcNAc transferase